MFSSVGVVLLLVELSVELAVEFVIEVELVV